MEKILSNKNVSFYQGIEIIASDLNAKENGVSPVGVQMVVT
jgi:hypothetical protein